MGMTWETWFIGCCLSSKIQNLLSSINYFSKKWTGEIDVKNHSNFDKSKITILVSGEPLLTTIASAKVLEIVGDNFKKY